MSRRRIREFMKVLVTGGTGFIGSKVAHLLSKKNVVYVLTRNKSLKDRHINYICSDLRNSEEVEKAVQGKDAVVHLGALIKGKEKEILKINVLSTKNIVEACKKNKIQKLVFASSDVVFQKHKSEYSESKKIGEELVKQLENYCILRPTVVYGMGDKINLGKVIELIKKTLFIIIPGNGKHELQPIHVEDVAQYINNAVEYDVKGTYVLAGKDKVTFNEFINKVCNILNVKRLKIHLPLFLMLPIAWLLQKIPSVGISVSQIKNLNTNKTYNITETINSLKHEPMSLDDGLKKTFKVFPELTSFVQEKFR